MTPAAKPVTWAATPDDERGDGAEATGSEHWSGMATEADYREYIKRAVDTAPPLKPGQIARLTGLFDYEKPAG